MKEITIPILILVFFFCGAIFLTNLAMKSQCANNVTEMGREYRYSIINGCRVQLKDGTFIYWKMFREFSPE